MHARSEAKRHRLPTTGRDSRSVDGTDWIDMVPGVGMQESDGERKDLEIMKASLSIRHEARPYAVLMQHYALHIVN
ncbi:hypothetical protein An01g09720 [Aspergillus niger]|uniref:Uncharacterized protein n=2 Tax=Aspergillus niger TaxID=5061 RepID=A2QA03_ASPNC|nr:hypothetical protein An01g09720 [Aspergillus niger]CAK37155.1 hypothetical protein An01g09720 [Aspergillus niger]